MQAHLVVAIGHDCTPHCKDGHASGTSAWQAAVDADGGEATRWRHVLQHGHVLDGLQVHKKPSVGCTVLDLPRLLLLRTFMPGKPRLSVSVMFATV